MFGSEQKNAHTDRKGHRSPTEFPALINTSRQAGPTCMQHSLLRVKHRHLLRFLETIPASEDDCPDKEFLGLLRGMEPKA